MDITKELPLRKGKYYGGAPAVRPLRGRPAVIFYVLQWHFLCSYHLFYQGNNKETTKEKITEKSLIYQGKYRLQNIILFSGNNACKRQNFPRLFSKAELLVLQWKKILEIWGKLQYISSPFSEVEYSTAGSVASSKRPWDSDSES